METSRTTATARFLLSFVATLLIGACTGDDDDTTRDGGATPIDAARDDAARADLGAPVPPAPPRDGGDDDATPSADATPGEDGGPSLDADTDAGPTMDARVDDDAGPAADAGDDAGPCGHPDASRLDDGGLSGCGSMPVAACTGATAAPRVSFTMRVIVGGTTVVTTTRVRHTFDVSGDALRNQHSREMSTLAGTPTDLLRVYDSASPGSIVIYTLAPPTPHPFTLVPSARRDVVAVMGELNGLATFPTYGNELLRCLDRELVECTDERGVLAATDEERVEDGRRCRVFDLGGRDSGLQVCVPIDCAQRVTLYPLSLSGFDTEVHFDSLAPADFDDSVVEEPAPCDMPVPGLELCTLP